MKGVEAPIRARPMREGKRAGCAFRMWAGLRTPARDAMAVEGALPPSSAIFTTLYISLISDPRCFLKLFSL